MNGIDLINETLMCATDLRIQLDQAQQADRDLTYLGPEYRENRQRIARLTKEIWAIEKPGPAEFTEESYRRNPDSFEMSAINRQDESARFKSKLTKAALWRGLVDLEKEIA